MARFELQSLADYSDEAVLQEIRRVAQTHAGGPFTLSGFRKLAPRVSGNTIRRRFGDWKSAIEKAGLAHLSVERFATRRQEKLRRGRGMSDTELIAEVRKVHALLGRDALTAREFSRASDAHEEAVRERFGTWHAALERAGVAKPEAGRRYTDQACFENLAALWTILGRQPRLDEIKRPPSKVGPKAYIGRWRTWRRSLQAFVEWASSESEAAEPPSKASCGENQVRFGRASVGVPRNEEERREVRPVLRFKVFTRDHFRCVACGRSPAIHLGVELHADHIVSVYDGGKTRVENLQTLCQDCNLGKGRNSIKPM